MLRENVLTVNPVMAKAIGVNEAIILNQIDYWIDKNEENEVNHYDGRYWTFSTYNEMIERDYPWLSNKTLRRAVKKLEELNLIITTDKYNKMKYDQTKWYTVNYEEVDKILYKDELETELEAAELQTAATDEMAMDRGVVNLTKGGGQSDQGGVQVDQGGWSKRPTGVAKMTSPIQETKKKLKETKKEINKTFVHSAEKTVSSPSSKAKSQKPKYQNKKPIRTELEPDWMEKHEEERRRQDEERERLQRERQKDPVYIAEQQQRIKDMLAELNAPQSQEKAI